MKQKFTTEKHKYLENKKSKNETMFNFKISCLMKKQVINLMMTLAIVFGLSVSAMAQGSTADPGDTWTDFDGLYYNDPTFMIQNSIRGFQVDAHTDNTYAWTVYTVNIGTGVATAAAGTDYSLWANSDGTGPLDGSQNAIYIEWLAASDADEVYALEVTETNDITGNCTSVRRFYVLVYGVDMEIVASNSLGAEISSNLLTCNLWSGDVIGNDLTATQLGEADGSHDNFIFDGTQKFKYDTIYANVNMAGSLGDWVTNGTVLTAAEDARVLAASDVDEFRWTFDYVISTDAAGTNFDPAADGSILSVTATNNEAIYFDTEDTGNNFLGTDLNNTPVWTTVLGTDDITGSVYVAKGTTSFTLTIALHNIFNQTVSPSISFEGSNLALERADFGGDTSFNDGSESDLTNNASAVQTRYASPATPVITITD